MSIRVNLQCLVKGYKAIKGDNSKFAFGLQMVRPFSVRPYSVTSKTISRKVLIPTSLDSIAEEMLTKNDFEVISDSSKGMDIIDEHPDASYLIVRSEKVDESVLSKLENLTLVVRAGAGFNTIDTEAARRESIDVMNTPGANANAVAEEVVAMILAVYRHIVPADKSTRIGNWEKKLFMGMELHKKTVGIAGLGNIGQLVVQRISGFDCDIVAYDPYVSESKAKELGIKLVHNLEDLFSQSDIITLHIPETDETRGVVNKKIFDLMKDGSCIINAARSGIIDEEALREAKKTKSIYFCTDVYNQDAAGDKPVKDVADLMLPHLGANTFEANKNAAERAASQLISYADRGLRTYVVNRNIPEGLDDKSQKLAYYLSKIAHSFNGFEAHPDAIETSYYGSLGQFQDWFSAPIVMGLGFGDFDPLVTKDSAAEYLQKKGITLTSRTVDNSKGYGDSITVDMLYGSGNKMLKVSLRGTITEGVPRISRIDDFENLYCDPIGHTTLIHYHDMPGMLAKITNVIARHEVNIEEIRCPHHKKSGCSLAVIHTNVPIGNLCLEQIRRDCNPIKATYISIRPQ